MKRKTKGYKCFKMRKTTIMLSVLIFSSTICMSSTKTQKNNIDSIQSSTSRVYKQVSLQQRMSKNQNSLEEVILQTIRAYQNQDEKSLNKLILEKFGIAFVYRRGVMDEFSFSERISFNKPVPEYLPFDCNIAIADYKVHFEELPFFSCATEKWDKPPGIYCDTTNTDKTLSDIVKFRNEILESNYTEREVKKIEKTEKECYKVIVIGKEGNVFVFCLTFIENKWYITVIDRFEVCSA